MSLRGLIWGYEDEDFPTGSILVDSFATEICTREETGRTKGRPEDDNLCSVLPNYT